MTDAHSNYTAVNIIDPGRLHYRIQNIYLNFLETFGRLPPTSPITLHQKALFTFWMSVVILWTFMQLWKLHKLLARQNKSNYTTIPDKETHTRQEEEISEEEVELEGVKITYSPSKLKLQSSPSKNKSPSDAIQLANSPARRKDYLDQSAFDATERGTEQLSTNTYVKATLCDGTKVEAQIHEKIMKLKEEKLEMLKEDEPSKIPFLKSLKEKGLELFFASDKDQPTFEKFLSRMVIFGCFMFYFFLTDYLHFWPKVSKQYSRDMFVFLFFLLVFVAVLFTIRQTKEKLLNRDQTEEWKGWMQVQFVWYHYYDAQETFNSIRCYVGGYVWMTGFGNYIYFSTRKDYSIFRLLKMLFRLNFLVFCIMAVTNNVFVRYYICAMHTYWFISVWAVMVAFNKYNSSQAFLLLKFGIYASINAMIFNIPGASEKIFTPLKWALHDKDGTLRYWKYRAWLDHWSTLVGMLFAFNYERFDEFLKYLDKDDPKTKQQRETIRYVLIAILLTIFGVWLFYILLLPKEQYLAVHPFTSPLPIVIYAMLRNLHPILRSYNLNLFTWLGKITLETYLSQIHLYMMGDAKAILVYLPRYPMLNFTLATLIYVATSYVLFRLTVFFSSYIFPRNGHVVIKNIILGTAWLGSCYILSYILTMEHIWRSDKSGLEFLIWKVKKY